MILHGLACCSSDADPFLNKQQTASTGPGAALRRTVEERRYLARYFRAECRLFGTLDRYVPARAEARPSKSSARYAARRHSNPMLKRLT